MGRSSKFMDEREGSEWRWRLNEFPIERRKKLWVSFTADGEERKSEIIWCHVLDALQLLNKP